MRTPLRAAPIALSFLFSGACALSGDGSAPTPDGPAGKADEIDIGQPEADDEPGLGCAEGHFEGTVRLVRYHEGEAATIEEVETHVSIERSDQDFWILMERTIGELTAFSLWEMRASDLKAELEGNSFYLTSSQDIMCAGASCTASFLVEPFIGTSDTFRLETGPVERLCYESVVMADGLVDNRSFGCLEKTD